MSRIIYTDSQHYQNIANAIRAKSDNQESITPAQMANAIDKIPIYAVEITVASDIHDINLDVDLSFDPHSLNIYCLEPPQHASFRTMYGFVYSKDAKGWRYTNNGVPFYYNPDAGMMESSSRDCESAIYGGISLTRNHIHIGGVSVSARWRAGTTYRIIITG